MAFLTVKEIQTIETNMLYMINRISETNNLTYYLRAGSLLGAIRHNGPIPWDTDIDIEVPINEYKKFYESMKNELPYPYKAYWIEDKNYARLFIRIGIENIDESLIHVDVFPMIGIHDEQNKQANHLRKILLIQWIYKTKKYSLKELYHIRKKLFGVLVIAKAFFIIIPSTWIENYTFKQLKLFNYDKSNYVVNPFSKYRIKSIFNKSYYHPSLKCKYSYFDAPIPNKFDVILSKLYGDYRLIPSDEITNKVMNTQFPINNKDYDFIITHKLLEKEREYE